MRVRTALKREEIVTAAAQAFRELGFERTSMSEISARVGGSKATLYGYFESKEELFLAVVDSEASTHFAPVLDELNANDDVRAALRGFGLKFLAFILQPHAVAAKRMVVAMARQSDIGAAFYINGPKKGLTMIASYLAKMIDNGSLKPGDASVMAQHLLGLLEAELAPEFMFGVRTEPPAGSVIEAVVDRALAVFFAAYHSP